MTFLPAWLIYALITMFFYGLWAFFPKLATLYLPTKEILIYQIIGILAVGFIALLSSKQRLQFNSLGLLFAILGGAAGLIGTLFFLKSLAIGKTYVVVTLTALYPIITIILAFIFLRESLTLKNAIGVVFAFIAMYLFAS
ncbi:MAG: EamA family transporter [Candidatus Cloacimonetes bacterium]|nr:EamA family transporter [Candidatus Cloacimonadota bacterium]